MLNTALHNLSSVGSKQRPCLLLDVLKVSRVGRAVVLGVAHAGERLRVAAGVAPNHQPVCSEVIRCEEVKRGVLTGEQGGSVVILRAADTRISTQECKIDRSVGVISVNETTW